MTDVVITQAGQVLEIQLNRPEKNNALTGAMYQAVQDAFGRADEDAGIRVVLLTGAGDTFTSGNDISFLPPDSCHVLHQKIPSNHCRNDNRLGELFGCRDRGTPHLREVLTRRPSLCHGITPHSGRWVPGRRPGPWRVAFAGCACGIAGQLSARPGLWGYAAWPTPA